MKRPIIISKDGFKWILDCPSCPLKSHLEVLKMAPRSCSVGLMTNLQGAIPISTCEYMEKDSLADEEKGLHIVCNHTKS